MKLWLISQVANSGYDTYDSAVVAAENEDAARVIHPAGYAGVDWSTKNGRWERDGFEFKDYVWTTVHLVTVEYLGEAKAGTEEGVICASFNAG